MGKLQGVFQLTSHRLFPSVSCLLSLPLLQSRHPHFYPPPTALVQNHPESGCKLCRFLVSHLHPCMMWFTGATVTRKQVSSNGNGNQCFMRDANCVSKEEEKRNHIDAAPAGTRPDTRRD